MKPSLTSISMEKALLDRAREMAKRRRQSFSAYVATLIELDIQHAIAQKQQKQPA